jgi:hypothetical protein
MNREIPITSDIIEALETIRLRLNSHLRDTQLELNTLQEDREIPACPHELFDLIERLDSARVHLYVAGEYLRGNSEWAFIRDSDEDNSFANQKGA